MKSVYACLACSALLLNGPALAHASPNSTQQSTPSNSGAGPSGFLAVGAGVAPAFQGTDEYEAIPFFFGDVKWHRTDIRLQGMGLRIDLLGNSALDIGPIISYQPKRNSSDGSGRVRRLKDVKAAAELGGFIGYRLGGDRYGEHQIALSLSGVHDINDAYDGVLVAGRISYAALRTRKFSIDVDARSTWGDQDYQQTYFGISHDNSIRSGLPRYNPDSGFRDVTVGLTVGYQLNARWGLLARTSLTRYVGDTADSPIIHEGGQDRWTHGVCGLLPVLSAYYPSRVQPAKMQGSNLMTDRASLNQTRISVAGDVG